jgi:hypothetical protein
MILLLGKCSNTPSQYSDGKVGGVQLDTEAIRDRLCVG